MTLAVAHHLAALREPRALARIVAWVGRAAQLAHEHGALIGGQRPGSLACDRGGPATVRGRTEAA